MMSEMLEDALDQRCAPDSVQYLGEYVGEIIVPFDMGYLLLSNLLSISSAC
jgi:hypothetical protein